MQTFKIERGVPMPKIHVSRSSYPFAEMEVGDSFAVPLSGDLASAGKNGDYDRTQVRVRSAACSHQRRHGGKFSVRVNKAEGVLRCWRVA